jgi:hypothetical protein
MSEEAEDLKAEASQWRQKYLASAAREQDTGAKLADLTARLEAAQRELAEFYPGRIFVRSDKSLGCAECCNGDRCDDPTHRVRKDCRFCEGTGTPISRADKLAVEHQTTKDCLSLAQKRADALAAEKETLIRATGQPTFGGAVEFVQNLRLWCKECPAQELTEADCKGCGTKEELTPPAREKKL